MKKFLLILFVFTIYKFSAQTVMDSATYQQLKSEIKKEIQAENQQFKQEHQRLFHWEKFSLRGYGVVNYYNYGTFDTDYSMKDKMDPERLNLYLEYQFNDKLSFKSEIEFEL